MLDSFWTQFFVICVILIPNPKPILSLYPNPNPIPKPNLMYNNNKAKTQVVKLKSPTATIQLIFQIAH